MIYKTFKNLTRNFRFKEKFGIISNIRPKGKIIWFYASTIENLIDAKPLIKRLTQDPNHHILITCDNLTADSFIEINFPKNVSFQLIPFDFSIFLRKFFYYWKPHLGIIIENNKRQKLLEISSSLFPMILLNGLVSNQDFIKFKNNLNYTKNMFKKYSLILPQSQSDKEKYQVLGGENILFCGNLKLIPKTISVNDKKLIKLQEETKHRKILLASLTQNSEEEQLINIYSQLKNFYPDLLIVIIPDDPNRKDEIINEIMNFGLNMAVRSLGDKLNDSIDIYLADNLAELSLFTYLASVVFIGGSLTLKGGYNFLEIAKLEKVIILGPNMGKFNEVTKNFIQNEAVIEVKDDEELFKKLFWLFAQESRLKKYKEGAKHLVLSYEQALEENLNQISNFIKRAI